MKKSLYAFGALILLVSCEPRNTIRYEESDGAIEVLTLGTFHFNFPNLDISKIATEDQIDVLDPVYQQEIEGLLDQLEKFHPTKIMIECQPEKQGRYDSLYQAYLAGNYTLSRNEEEQVGFRLAQRLGLERLYCVDAWGDDYESLKNVLEGSDSVAQKKFMDYFYNNPDSLLMSYRQDQRVFKTQGILAELRRINSPEALKRSLGDYLVSIFKYETADNKQFGPDFVTGWWFNRNLRIFRNIQRIDSSADDRILVIYGAGHMNLLNLFFDSSPEYHLQHVSDYLSE